MKNTGFVFILGMVLLTLVSCASMQPVDKTQLLRTEWERWQNFETEGVVQITNSGLTLRKMFVLSKTPEAIRFDILSGGSQAANAKPLLSLYLGDYLAIQCPAYPQIEILAQVLPDTLYAFYTSSDSLVAIYQDTIINTNKLTLGSVELLFNDSMQLEKITETLTGVQLSITRNSKGDPDKVKLIAGASTSIELLIDSITYGNAEIIPLPPNPRIELTEEMKTRLKNLLEK
jgi:hypothetical protein